MTRRFFKGGKGTSAPGGDAAERMVREMPSFWLADLVDRGGVDPVQAAVARRELDRRGREAQDTLLTFLDRISSRVCDEEPLVDRAA